MSNRYDILLDNVGMRLVRGEDGQIGYRRRMFRPQIQRQTTNVPGVLSSDPNRWATYQTSWGKGSAWWKPSLSTEVDSYFTARTMNVWRKPGQIEPWNSLVETDLTSTHNWTYGCPMVPLGGTNFYAIGKTTINNAPNFDYYLWDDDTAAWSLTSYSSGNTTPGHTLLYDDLLGAILQLTATAIYQWNNTGHGTSLVSLGVNTNTHGSSMFFHNGRLMVYTGDILLEIENRTTTPVVTTITDDGFGLDWLASHAGGMIGANRLAVSTAEGVYYVKNVEQHSSVVPYIFRIERDSTGAWNSVPIATLPVGSVALSIGYHLGSVIVSASQEGLGINEADVNPRDAFAVTFYHVTGGNLGTLGVPLGDDIADETPYEILLSDGPHLYIGGQKRIWVYDAVRGGLHPWFEFDTPSTDMPCRVMTKVADNTGTGAPYLHFMLADTSSFVKEYYVPGRAATALATVTNFGDDLTTYTLESNYFDYDTPMEDKGIVGVHILTDPITSNARWTLQLSVDDGAFTTFATHSDTATGYLYTVFSSPADTWTGKRFRYKLIYETKVATYSVPVRAIMFEAMPTVRMVESWELRIDGTEFLNVEGELLRPEDVYDKLELLAQTDRPIAFVDYFRSERREDAGTYSVMLQSVEILKDQPHEAYMNITIERTDNQ